MTLLHDLAESKIGDITPEQMTSENKMKIENDAFNEIIDQLPETIKSQYLEIWKEYQNNNSKESKTDLIPYVIPSNTLSPLITAKSKTFSTPSIEANLILGCVGKSFIDSIKLGKL